MAFINGDERGGNGNGQLKLLYAGRRTDAGLGVARSGRLGSAAGGDGGRVAGLVARSELGGVGPAGSGSWARLQGSWREGGHDAAWARGSGRGGCAVGVARRWA